MISVLTNIIEKIVQKIRHRTNPKDINLTKLRKRNIQKALSQGWSYTQVSTYNAIFLAPPYTHDCWKTPIEWEHRAYRKSVIMVPKSFKSLLL